MFSVKTITIKSSLLSASIVLALSACAQDQNRAYHANYHPDYRARHPLVLTEAPKYLALYPDARQGMSARQWQDVRAFVQEFRSKGRGPMLVMLPPSYMKSSNMGAFQRVFSEAGLGRENIRFIPSQLSAMGAGPIELSYSLLQAKLTQACGDWREDISGGPTLIGAENRAYPNLGCATQSMFAAQVDDPLDLVRPRVMGASDAEKRLRDIRDVRENRDPTTVWRQEAPTLSPNVGQGGR